MTIRTAELPDTPALKASRDVLWSIDYGIRSGQPTALPAERLHLALAALVLEHENLRWQHERLRLAAMDAARGVAEAVASNAKVAALVEAYTGPDSNVPADWAQRRHAAERRLLAYLEAQAPDPGLAPALEAGKGATDARS